MEKMRSTILSVHDKERAVQETVRIGITKGKGFE